jgi:hypothetical protein
MNASVENHFCHPGRSVHGPGPTQGHEKWPDTPQFPLPPIELEGSAMLRLVIPTEAQRSGGTCGSPHPTEILLEKVKIELSARVCC